MKRRIVHRYDISSGCYPAITWKEMKKGARFVFTGAQSERPTVVSVWFEMNPDEFAEDVWVFTWIKTGESLPDDEDWEYLGSQIQNGFHVYHIYCKSPK